MTLELLMLMEQERVQKVRRIQWLKEDKFYDEIALIAATICDVPISAVSVVLDDRQYFKGKYGMSINETPIEQSICRHTLHHKVGEPLIICDMLEDEKFKDTIIPVNDEQIRFYCGCPFVSLDGVNIGTVCAVDTVPRVLTDRQKESMVALSQILRNYIRIQEVPILKGK